jgi:AbiV family abortive infection protein
MQSSSLLSADFLLRGAFYAAEHAGILLHDAIELYKLRRFGTSTILAVYSREEVGRSRILLEHLDRALRGEIVNRADLQDLFRNHIRKLEAGQFICDIELPPRKLREISAEEMGHPKCHPEDAPFYAEWHRRTEATRKKRARTSHNARLYAIHVNLSDDGQTWTRPSVIHKDWVSMLLEYVSLDYSMLHRVFSELESLDMAKSLEAWGEHPALLAPMYIPREKSDG